MNTLMQDCWRCARRAGSRQVVWPTIVPGAKFLVVGEAPGYDEDRAGQGFVGKAGDTLRRAIAKVGLDPVRDVSYANTVACFGGSIKNKPKPGEVDICSRHLWRAIRMALHNGTQVVVAAGRYAYKAIVGTDCKIGEESGTYKICRPPKDVWSAVCMEEFCVNRGLEFPVGTDGIAQDQIRDPDFIGTYATDLMKWGFQFEQMPEIKVVPSFHPSYFNRDGNHSEIYKLESALDIARKWAEGGAADQIQKDYKAVFSAAEAIEYINTCIAMFERREVSYIALDLETVGGEGNEVDGGLQPFVPGGRIITINLSHKPHFARVIYMFHPEATMTVSEQAQVAQKYRELLAKVPIVGANLKFDMHWSRFKLGARKWTIAHDTQLMNYAVHLGTQPNDLKHLTSRFLHLDAGYEDHVQQFLGALDRKDRHYANIPSNLLTDYAAHDVDVVLQLIPLLTEQLMTARQWEPYQLFLIHPYPAFIEMEQNGAHLDTHVVAELKEEYEKRVEAPLNWFKEHSPYWDPWSRRRLAEAQEKRKKYKTKKSQNKPILAGEIDINFGSPDQVSELLFDIVRLPIWGDLGKPKKKLEKMFPNGVPSTKEEALENIQENIAQIGETTGPRVEILEKVMQFRKDAKILSGYLKKAFEHCPVMQKPEWWDSRASLMDMRSYEAELYSENCQSASYNLTVTRTARSSSSRPNLQQITLRMRRMYVARLIEVAERLLAMGLDPAKNLRRLVANFDVGQAELRMMAVASQDPNFIAIMSDPDRDVHREVAAKAYKKSESEVTKEERTETKRVVFGTAFGRSPQGVAAQLRIPVEHAKDIQAALFNLMPQTQLWIEQMHQEGQNNGGVWTPTGRYRDLRMYTNKGDRNRRAVNTPIQGGASDLTFWATGWVHREMRRVGMHSLLWTFVHDNIVFDTYPQEAEHLMSISRHYFSTATLEQFKWYNVPLVLEFQFGVDWEKQVDAVYNEQTREFKLEGKEKNLVPVYDAFAPLLTEIEFDPEWAQKVSKMGNDGKPDPEDVWVRGRFA